MNEKLQKKLKHLGYIQNIIDRMARNSFLIKGWSFGIFTFLSFLIKYNSQEIKDFGFIFSFLIIILWYLDTYFLKKERYFRKLYDFIREKDDTDFSMKFDPEVKKSCYCEICDFGKVMFFTLALTPFYLSLSIILICLLWSW